MFTMAVTVGSLKPSKARRRESPRWRFHLTKRQTMSGGAFGAPSFSLGKLLALSRFLLGKATLLVLVATAAGAGIIASRFGHRGQ